MTIRLGDIWPLQNTTDYKVHFARWNGDFPAPGGLRQEPRGMAGMAAVPAGPERFQSPAYLCARSFYHRDGYVAVRAAFTTYSAGRKRITTYRFRRRASVHRTFEAFDPAIAGAQRGQISKIITTNSKSRKYCGSHIRGGNFPAMKTSTCRLRSWKPSSRMNGPDWKAALENTKGVYLISDTATGKRYIGSAYSDQEIWSRWCAYVASGHGGNVELRALVSDPSLDYCRTNFRFALLEAPFGPNAGRNHH